MSVKLSRFKQKNQLFFVFVLSIVLMIYIKILDCLKFLFSFFYLFILTIRYQILYILWKRGKEESIIWLLHHH